MLLVVELGMAQFGMLIKLNGFLMKLRVRDAHVLAGVQLPWYRSGMGLVLSAMLLLPLSVAAADAPDPGDSVEQELQELRQLAQKMLLKIEALERTQKIKKGIATAPGGDVKLPPATPIPTPPPVVDNTPLPVFKVTPKAFEFSGNTVFSTAQLNKEVEEYLGKETDFEKVEEIAEKVKTFYRKKGYFLALAFLPKQEIDGGVIKIDVLEGRIGKVTTQPVSSDAALTEAQFKGMVHSSLKEGDLITENSLERPLLQMRDLPGVDIVSTITQGDQLGMANIDLKLVRPTNARKISSNVEFDNAGNRFAGEYRATLKATVNGLFGIGDALNVTGTIGEAPLNVFGRFGYLAPVGYMGTRAGFNLSRVNYLLGKDFAALNVEGNATISELLVVRPFLRNKDYNLFGQVSFENKLLTDKQGTTPVQKRSINSIKLQFNGDLRGVSSINTGNIDLTLGHLKIQNAQTLEDDQSDAGFHTSGSFLKANFTYNHLRTLPVKNLEGWFAISGQFASKNLTSAEKFVLGGPGRVRGYPAGEAGGDQGFVATGELRYSMPGFKFGKTGGVALSAFIDYGWIARNAKSSQAPQGDGSSNTRSLYGYGIGFNIGEQDNFLLRSDVAWGGSGASTSDTKASNPRLWFQGIKWF